MQSGNTHLVKQFDDFFIRHRSELKTQAQQIFYNHRDFEDHLMDNFIKIRTRIELSGFTQNKYTNLDRSFYSFFWRSLSNDNKLLKKRESRLHFVDINDTYIEERANEVLMEQLHDKEPYYHGLDVIKSYLYHYVGTKFSDKHLFLFKIYYEKPEARSYQKLKNITGYTMKSIKEIIRCIKQDVRTNFIPWLKEELIRKQRCNGKDLEL